MIVARGVDAMKRAWHRDLVDDPEAHAWVLSLYRAGELYPDTVDDYFPARHAPWPWLAEALTRHHDDERRHGAMFARAITRAGFAIEAHAGDDVFNHVIRACTPAPWRIDDGDAGDVRRAKLAHFLAHAHHLERRVSRSLEMHFDACEQGGATVAAKVVETVLRDEVRHVGYTLDAARELVGDVRAEGIVALHARAEARADLLFSARQVRRFLARFGSRATPSRRARYTLCAALQSIAASVA